MSKWRPVGSIGGLIGLAIIAVLTAGAGYLIWRAINPLRIDLSVILYGIGAGLLLAVVALVGYWAWGYFNLAYYLDRNGLTIRWAGERQHVPMESMERLVSAERIDPGIKLRGVNWPGYHIGHDSLGDRGELVVYATTSLTEQIFVVTPTLIYGISPRDPDKFRKEFELRRSLGQTGFHRQMTTRSRFVSFPLWSDRAGQSLLALGIILNFALFGYLAWRYGGLPTRLPVHYNAMGQVDLIGDKSEMMRIPIIGLIAVFVNAALGFFVHEWDRLAGYLLLAAAGVVQVVLWIAVLNILF